MKKENKKKGGLFVGLGAALATVSLAFAALATPANEFEEERGEIDSQDPNHLVLPIHEEQEVEQHENILDKIPIVLRSAFCVILWGIGTILLNLTKAVTGVVLAPVLSFILGFLGIFAILFLIILCCLKLFFPDKKLRQLINKRVILIPLIGALIIQCARTFLPMVWKEYAAYEFTVTFILGLIIILLVLIPELIKDGKEPMIIYEFDGKEKVV